MKLRLKLTAVLAVCLMIFTGCTSSSSSAFMKVQSLTENGWIMNVEKLNGTDTVNLKPVINGEAYKADVIIGLEHGAVTIEFRDGSGNAVYTSEKMTKSGKLTVELDSSAYRMAVIAEDFGGTVEVEIKE